MADRAWFCDRCDKLLRSKPPHRVATYECRGHRWLDLHTKLDVCFACIDEIQEFVTGAGKAKAKKRVTA